MKILVTGASGYIGGRLVRVLLERGHQVRVLVRDADQVRGRRWADQVGVHVGDLTRLETLTSLCQGVDVAYYLVHSMMDGADFARRDRQAAENFAAVAGGLRHLIYLGGLLPRSAKVSRHLGSRAEVGSLLRERLPTTELRAGPIIGSGSASFEMVRYLTERPPVMVASRSAAANPLDTVFRLRDAQHIVLEVRPPTISCGGGGSLRHRMGVCGRTSSLPLV